VALWSLVAGLCACALAQPPAARAQSADRLADPLRLPDVLRYARAHRAEIQAAQARARAAAARPDAVSGMEDPVVFPALNHLPFDLKGANYSLTVEQRFPLSSNLSRRRRVAEAELSRVRSEGERVALDVELRAAEAFLMLHERRAMARIVAAQQALAQQVVQTAAARYATASSTQADALRAEIEVARLAAAVQASAAEIRAAEIMLNVNLGRAPDAAVPELALGTGESALIAADGARKTALARRPELRSSLAEVNRYTAEVSVMESMYTPMAMLRTGPAYTMMDGPGWMLEVGLSVPLWRDKLRAGVSEARAMVEMAQADSRALRNMIEGEVLAAREQVLGARARYVALQEQVVPRAQQAIEPAIAAYAAGQLPLVSVIETAQALWTSEAELVSAEVELGLAAAKLDRALGARGNKP
jgi:outer membrane protein TolC